ncbi:MAG: carboxypeptidase regulatory-like domain-containing protein [Planctomycetes bacterium]|nr:carboxypeptidase regulatory-like domain-containing protein [Planctomycetota bacterium]
MYVGQDGLALPPIELEVERAALPLAEPLTLPIRARAVLELALDGAEAAHVPLRLATAHVDADGAFTHWTWRSVLGPTCVLPGLDPDARLMLSAESALLGSASAILEPEPLVRGARTARLRLENPGASIQARLRGPDGRWLTDTWVETRLLLRSLDRAASGASFVRRLRSDALGRLHVPLGPSLAEFQVRMVVLADPRDADPCGASLSAQREGGTRTLELGDVDCARYVRLCAGRVEDEAGAPLADVEVVARDQSFGEHWSTTSRGDGSFEVWGLRRSNSLRVEAAGARELVELGSRGNVLRAGPPRR